MFISQKGQTQIPTHQAKTTLDLNTSSYYLAFSYIYSPSALIRLHSEDLSTMFRQKNLVIVSKLKYSKKLRNRELEKMKNQHFKTKIDVGNEITYHEILKYHYNNNLYNIIYFMLSALERVLPNKKLSIPLQDKMIISSLPYYFLFVTCFSGFFGNQTSSFVFIFIIYGIIPLIDELLPMDEVNPNQAETKQLLENDFKFKICLYATMIVDWIHFFRMMNIFSTYQIDFSSIANLVGMVFIYFNLNSVQFAVAHEIFHKGGFNKYLGTFHMVKNLYMHFTYEHLYGHHKRVATPQDPATALKNTNVYSFFFRSYFGSFRSVYQMEVQEKKSFIQNYSVQSALASLFFTIMMFKLYGLQGGIFFLILAYGSIFYLEAVNYIEHYGILRKKLQNGQYEPVTIQHSWNASHRFSNYLLFKLQRHSDHHENSYKPYQVLLSFKESPQLPHGYTVMVIMAFFPPIFHKVMNPLVEAYYGEKDPGQEMNRSIKETRKFIIQLFLTTLMMMVMKNFLNF